MTADQHRSSANPTVRSTVAPGTAEHTPSHDVRPPAATGRYVPHPASADPPPLIRNRGFQALWSSRFFAGLGKESGEVAYPLLCLALAGSASQAGTIGAAQVVTAIASTYELVRDSG